MPQRPYKASLWQRKRVSMLVATGMGERGIALALKCSRETLRTHFADELQDGRDLYRAELLDLLQRAANKGSVSAMRHLDKRTSGETANPGGFAGGKKAEQAKAAEAAMGEWGDDLAPIAVPVRTN